MDWWNELTGLQQIFAYIAIPSTMIMVFQFIMSLFGFVQGNGIDDFADGDGAMDFADGDGAMDFDDGISSDIAADQPQGIYVDHLGDTVDEYDSDTDGHADSLKLFTLRGIIGFLSIGGWMGVAAISWGVPIPGVVLLALLSGWIALYFVAWSLRAVLRLQQSGNIVMSNAIGLTGEVYIPVPPLKSGVGKVHVVIQDRLSEVNAVTDAKRTLKTGEKITVLGVENEGILLVVPMELPKNNAPEGVIKTT